MRKSKMRRNCDCDCCCIDDICTAETENECTHKTVNYCSVEECKFFGNCLYEGRCRACLMSA